MSVIQGLRSYMSGTYFINGFSFREIDATLEYINIRLIGYRIIEKCYFHEKQLNLDIRNRAMWG